MALAWTLGFGLIFAAPASAATVDRLAAVVDDQAIALSEVYELGADFIAQRCAPAVTDRCRREGELEVLDALIQRSLMRQELDRLGMTVTGEEVDRAIDGMLRQYQLPDRAALERELSAQGIAWDAYYDQIREQLQELKFSENVIRPRIEVTDAELIDLYQRTARDAGGPLQAELGALMVPLDPARPGLASELVAVVEALNAGQRDWLATVQELDAGVYKGRDGRMGTFKKGDLPPALDAAVFAAPAGAVIGPFPTPDGNALVLLKVVSLGSSGVLPFDEVKERLREQIYQTRTDEAVEQWYQQARRQAAVRILLQPVL